MSDTKVGVPPPPGAGRDAIHMAVTPAVAAEFLSPGEHVGRMNDGTFSTNAKALGIVDPFLLEGVDKGETFWLFLYPQTITGLTHVWTHPAFEDVAAIPSETPHVGEIVARSRRWMTDFAARYGRSMTAMLEAADDYERYGEYLTGGSEMEGEYVPQEFWSHYTILTGRVPSRADNFFSCAC
jgi:hypothetical protein